LDSQSRWSKVKDKVESDPRYKAVDSSSMREDLFKQYIEKIAKVTVTAPAVMPYVTLLLLSQSVCCFDAAAKKMKL
jgi:hypothetical protein